MDTSYNAKAGFFIPQAPRSPVEGTVPLGQGEKYYVPVKLFTDANVDLTRTDLSWISDGVAFHLKNYATYGCWPDESKLKPETAQQLFMLALMLEAYQPGMFPEIECGLINGTNQPMLERVTNFLPHCSNSSVFYIASQILNAEQMGLRWSTEEIIVPADAIREYARDPNHTNLFISWLHYAWCCEPVVTVVDGERRVSYWSEDLDDLLMYKKGLECLHKLLPTVKMGDCYVSEVQLRVTCNVDDPVGVLDSSTCADRAKTLLAWFFRGNRDLLANYLLFPQNVEGSTEDETFDWKGRLATVEDVIALAKELEMDIDLFINKSRPDNEAVVKRYLRTTETQPTYAEPRVEAVVRLLDLSNIETLKKFDDSPQSLRYIW